MNTFLLLVTLSVVASACGFYSYYPDCFDCNSPCSDIQYNTILHEGNKKTKQLDCRGLNWNISKKAVPSWKCKKAHTISSHYFEAECEDYQCNGIATGKAVQILQTINMLFRQSCGHNNNKTILVEKPVKVAIACTCVNK